MASAGGGGLDFPQYVAIDGSGNAWTANEVGNSLSEFNSSGVANSSSPFTGGGLNIPNAVAVDGSGRVWIANGFGYGGVSEFSPAGSAICGKNGYSAGTTSSTGIALDGSGNVWAIGGTGVVEFVGVATPVVTPIVANLLPPYASNNSTVNKP